MRSQKNIKFYLIYFVALIVFIEVVSFFSVKYLSNYGFFYNPSIVKSTYADYEKYLDPDYGWLVSGVNGYRVDPFEFKDSKACVDVYGDSFTWGGEVSESESWPSFLTRELKCNVRNFGVSGYGSDQAYLRFKNSKSNSQIVILNHLSENILRNVNQYRNIIYPSSQIYLKPRFLTNNSKLTLSISKISSEEEFNLFLNNPSTFVPNDYFRIGGDAGIQKVGFPYTLLMLNLYKNWHFKSIISRDVRHRSFYDRDHPSRGLQVTKMIAENFFKITKKRNLVGIYAVLPTCSDFVWFEKNGFFPYKNLVDDLNSKNEHVYDIGAMMHEIVGDDYKKYYVDCSRHFNASGNYVVAKIYKKIIEGLNNVQK